MEADVSIGTWGDCERFVGRGLEIDIDVQMANEWNNVCVYEYLVWLGMVVSFIMGIAGCGVFSAYTYNLSFCNPKSASSLPSDELFEVTFGNEILRF